MYKRQSNDTFIAVQVSSDSALDADVTVSLQHATDNQLIDISDTSTLLVSGENTVLIETFDFTLQTLYLKVDVGSATVGTLSISTSTKKKEDSGGAIGTQDVNVTNSPLDVEVGNQILKETNIDAFNRLRVSQVNSQADLKQIHDNLPLFYDIEEIGTGVASHISSDAESTFNTSANNDVVIMQTKQRYNYRSGKSSLLYETFRHFNTETNITKRIGYYNSSTVSPYNSDLDGFYLENANGVISFGIAKTGVINNVLQSNWDDPMDGTGESGVDLDLGTDTGNLLMWCDYEWLGVGQIRFGFVKDGTFYIAHKEDHIMLDGVYMSSPNHSIRAEIRQTGAGSGTFNLICATYSSEGAINKLGKDGAIDGNAIKLDANSLSVWYYAIGIRLQASKLDTLVDILGGYLLATTNDKFLYRVLLNPTYTGSVTYVDITNYSVSYALGATSNGITSQGTILASGAGVQNSVQSFTLDSSIKLGAKIDGTLDEIVVVVKPLSSNLDIYRGINFRESD